MRTRRGFTVVELVVVMVIMAILLVLASFSISQSRANARDTERRADIEILARGLEARYVQGGLNPAVTTKPANVDKGSYPSTNEMVHILGRVQADFTPTQIVGGYGPVALPGTTVEAFSPPGETGAYDGFEISSGSCAVEDKTCIAAFITPDDYYYEPINESGTRCNSNVVACVRFNLYWEYETGDTSLQQYRSRRQ